MNADDPELEQRLADEVGRVAANIRRLAARRGLSIRRLNQLADLNPTTTFALLGGRTSPNLKTLLQIALALGVEVRDLFEPIPESDDAQG